MLQIRTTYFIIFTTYLPRITYVPIMYDGGCVECLAFNDPQIVVVLDVVEAKAVVVHRDAGC